MNDRRGEWLLGSELLDKKINQSDGEEIALENQFLIDKSRPMTEESNGTGNSPCCEEILLKIQFKERFESKNKTKGKWEKNWKQNNK